MCDEYKTDNGDLFANRRISSYVNVPHFDPSDDSSGSAEGDTASALKPGGPSARVSDPLGLT